MINAMMILLGIGALAAFVFYFYQQHRFMKNHRYKKEKTTHTTEPDFKIKEDPDVVLGLKPKEQAQTDSAVLPSTRTAHAPIVLYLMAQDDGVYAGYELLQALLSAGLQYGEQQIFHRHEHKDGRGEILFHCASAEKPGYFDLSNIGNFTTSGLTLFFTPEKVNDPLETFDVLLDTIDQLVEDLSGSVFDDQHELFTKTKMINMRQSLRLIAESNNTADLFAQTH